MITIVALGILLCREAAGLWRAQLWLASQIRPNERWCERLILLPGILLIKIQRSDPGRARGEARGRFGY